MTTLQKFPKSVRDLGKLIVAKSFQKLWEEEFFWSAVNAHSVGPDWAIYWTLGNFSKPLATIYLPKSPTFLGNFCKGVKIYHFSSEIIFGQLLWTFGDFFLVTLYVSKHFSIIWGSGCGSVGRVVTSNTRDL